MPGKHSSHVILLGPKEQLSNMTTVMRTLMPVQRPCLSTTCQPHMCAHACPPRAPSAGHTYKLQLPAFMLNTASTPMTLFDFHGVKRFGRGQHKDRVHHRAEFHLLYCNYPGLYKTCDFSGTTLCTCLNYSELRTRFLQDSGKCVPNKAQMPAALDARRIWGQHAGLTLPQQELCPGPERSVHVFDQAIVGNATLAMLHWLVTGLRSPSLLVIV
jgi:hypothetical protein